MSPPPAGAGQGWFNGIKKGGAQPLVYSRVKVSFNSEFHIKHLNNLFNKSWGNMNKLN